MADDRKIIIELSVVGDDDDAEEEKGNDEEKKSSKKSKTIKRMIKQTLDWTAREFLTQATYQFDRYVALTEDYKLQIGIDNIKTTVEKTKHLGLSVIAMAKIGWMAGGPGGAAIGASLGLVTTATSEGLNLMRQYHTQAFNLQMNDRQAQYAMSRLGLIDNGRGTQN